MSLVEIEVDATIGGVDAPGFPFTQLLRCSAVMAKVDVLGEGTTDVLASYLPADAGTINCIIIVPDKDIFLHIFNADDDNRLPLPAGSLFAYINCELPWSAAVPGVKIEIPEDGDDTSIIILVGIA